MTLRTAVAQGAELLGKAGVAEARLTAELLLCHAVHCERVYLYAHPEQELREVEWIHYGRWLHERMQGKPLQYITKTQEFYGRAFAVSPDVLIPRAETELLVETVLARGKGAGRMVDVGTGSGAIAITLALETRARVVATDISTAAIAVARGNAARLGAAPRVEFVVGDLLAAVAAESQDAVVSNPPYVAEADKETLQSEVRDWEPARALFAGANGLDVYRRLVPEAWRVLKPGGLLAMELGFGQAEAVAELVSEWGHVEVAKDLAGIGRVLSCVKGLYPFRVQDSRGLEEVQSHGITASS